MYGEHDYEVLTSAREGLQRQEDHFGSKQRHDTDGYNIIPFGYCTYRNRSDDGKFAFNINTISEKAIVSKFYPVFRFTNANSTFMAEFLNSSPRVKKKLSVLAVGTSQVVLSFEALKAAKFDLPCKDEQDKIAAFLECLNARIENQRTLVVALKKYKRGLLSAVFSQNVSMFSTADFYAFSELAVRRSEKYDPKCNAHAVCIELEHIEQETGRIIGSTCADYQNSIKTVCKPGDVMFGKLRPYLRKYAFVQKECVCSSEIWSLIPTDIVIPKYLFYLIQSEAFMKVANVSSGTKMPRAEWSTIAKSGYLIPSKDDQQATVDILETTDRIIVSHVASYDRLIEYKKGLLQRLFI
ncbi:restriction endonuclease subunit S [Gemmiger qucibialis]|uniref:restriction endonuclease subunit S n=1 Tax=Gemmiger qucibialis TaxID=2997294 RepID=UPI0022E2D4FA|nr:restriction endonuclease subunit S [Gemmiger qucibialis]